MPGMHVTRFRFDVRARRSRALFGCAGLSVLLALAGGGCAGARPLVATAAATPPAAAASVASLPADEVGFARDVAAHGGRSKAAIEALLRGAVVKQSILDAISRPAESKPWSQYRPIFVNPARIAAGVAFYRQHHALLEQVAQQYGVPPQFIVAIIGVETNYGANTGSYRVLDALVTLGFHYPPRAKFFRGELQALLELPDNHLPGPIPDIMGSYAGAMGLGQFMPSSIRDYGVDDDDDGRIDLLASLPDAFASIANYFRAHGWQDGQPVIAQAQAAARATQVADGKSDPSVPVSRYAADGYTPQDAVAGDPAANLLALDGAAGPEYWFTFHNFYVITRYNRSPMYALAVTQLAAAIARGVAVQ